MTAWMLRLHHHDERVLHALVVRRRAPLDRAMRALTHLGGATATVAATLFLLLGAVPGLRDEGMRAAVALVASHLVAQLLKRTVSRPRPRMPRGFAALVQPPDRFSFPSGHAAASLSLALTLAPALAGVPGAALVAVALAVGASRCYLGVHYPGDVVAGWLLALGGIACAPSLLAWIG